MFHLLNYSLLLKHIDNKHIVPITAFRNYLKSHYYVSYSYLSSKTHKSGQKPATNVHFYRTSGLIYGGISGLIDFSPIGTRLKKNIINSWEKYFIYDDDLLEIDTSLLTSDRVFETSGHLDKFSDLMISSNIGPLDKRVRTFLRPETAQGIFTNFDIVLGKGGKRNFPFGVAQVGKCFRNEIAPRGLTRLREFTLAEIEYFTNPNHNHHAKYHTIKDTKINLLSRSRQLDEKKEAVTVTIREAVDQGIITNQSIAYYLAKINNFLLNTGIDFEKMRFRQHLNDEMAHYATDCWDCECLISTGWLECVGCADRSSYDLKRHGSATSMQVALNFDHNEEAFVPYVVEPSFGIDRIMHVALEHNFKERQDSKFYLSIPPLVAPVQCAIFPVIDFPIFNENIGNLRDDMKELNIRVLWINTKERVGSNLVYCDHIGVPYVVTFDTKLSKSNRVAVREIETREQVVVDLASVAKLIKDLTSCQMSWNEAKEIWPSRLV